MLHLRGITRSFGRGTARVTALRGVDLDCAPGRLVGLFGNNGAGKTTLLRVIAGLVEPDEPERGTPKGSVVLDVGTAGRPRRPRGLDFGFASAEDRSFYPRLTVLENLAFHAQLRGLARREALERAERYAARLGLGGLLRRPFQSLSSGQRQRVNIARAVLHEPRVLLLDEPLRSLDAEASALVLDVARERCDAGAVVLVASHELSAVEPRCDDIVLLERGRVALAGPRESVLPRAAAPGWRLHFRTSEARARAERLLAPLDVDIEDPLALALAPGTGAAAVAGILARDELELASIERRDRPSVSALLRTLAGEVAAGVDGPARAPSPPVPASPAAPRDAPTPAAPERAITAGIRAVAAILRRDRQIHLTFKFRLAVQLVLIFVWAALYYFVAKLLRSDDPAVDAALRGNPLGFLLMGLVGLQLSQVALIHMSHVLREEQVAGTFEPLLASGRSPLLLVLGSLLWPLGLAIALVVGLIAFSQAALGARFELGAALPAALAALVGCAAFAALGLASAAFVLAFKRGDPVGGVLNMASLVVAGAYFPRELLPDSARTVAELLPHTHLLAALRSALLDGHGPGDDAFTEPLARLSLATAVLGVLAFALWRLALRYAERRGSLTEA